MLRGILMTELEKVSQAEVFINRYFEFEDAVTINNENKEYLKTYLHDEEYIIKNFNLKQNIVKSMALCGAAALVIFLLFFLFLGVKLIIVPIIAAIAVFILGTVFFVAFHKYRLTAALANQKEVNQGISEQIEILESRNNQLESQRDNYFKALSKKIDFMELDIDYMKNISIIKSYIEKGEAQTCEDAVALYEQNMLMQQMTNIISNSEHKAAPSHEENLERFGDPIKMLKEKKKKQKKQKKEKK